MSNDTIVLIAGLLVIAGFACYGVALYRGWKYIERGNETLIIFLGWVCCVAGLFLSASVILK